MPKETNNGLFQEYGEGAGYVEWKRDYGRLQIAINQLGLELPDLMLTEPDNGAGGGAADAETEASTKTIRGGK